MTGRGSGPDFVEALARGLDVLTSFDARRPVMSLSEVAVATGLARPTARRLLLTLAELGYVRIGDGGYALTPRVLDLGIAYTSSLGLWDLARPHLEDLVGRTRESSSMAQLDGSDIVYVARVSVPKIIALRVDVGTRFPAERTSQGKVLLAALPEEQVVATLAQPSRSGLPPRPYDADDLAAELVRVRAQGWALADEELAPGVRSVAAPVRDGSGTVRAAMNVTVHAAETSSDVLLRDHLPLLLQTAGRVSADWAMWQRRPHTELGGVTTMPVEPTVFERQAPPPATVERALAGSQHRVFWLDGLERPTHPQLTGQHAADLVIVGAGYTGLWTAILAKERDPGRRVIIVEACEVGWAASGRNGGFCEASLTHGEENGRSRWPEEYDQLERLGRLNLDEIEATVARYGMGAEFERTGTLSVATEPHQIEWLAEDPGFLDQRATRELVNSPTYLAGAWDRHDTALVHPGKLALELARVAVDLGVEIFEWSPVTTVDDGPVIRTATGEVHTDHVVLATNVFPSLLKRNRLQTVPVYDYVLATEPLSPTQQSEIGWTGRQGIADLANHFHYYRLTADDRIVFGGYDAVYHWGGKVRPDYEERPETYLKLAGHLLTTFPQLEGITITHRWAGAIDTCSRFCAFFGTARDTRIAYAAGFTGLGVGASRFAGNVLLDLLGGTPTERTELAMVRERPLPFPPEPLASLGIRLTDWSMHRADHRQGRRNLLLKALDAAGMGFDS